MPDATSSPLSVTDSIDQAGPYVDNKVIELTGLLTTLKSQLATLDETWTGESRVSYGQYQLEWDTAAKGLFGDGSDGADPGVLPQIAQALKAAAANYTHVEQTNKNSWRH